MLRVRRATALDGHRLELTLTNGNIVVRDIGALLWGPVFEPLLADDMLFRQVTVRAGTVAWPGDADLDPDVLIWGGPAPRDPALRPPLVLRLERTPAHA
ncbi:MAG TPA: DUF2442 domain-containing protein [Patescibacteria group bacterium]|nr:DUF2442 domain-containing protein [Patescibacteria group bacterium]